MQSRILIEIELCDDLSNKYALFLHLFGAAALHHHLLLLSLKFLLADLLLALLGLLGDSLLTFGQDHFDVARVRHEWIDSTVGAVRSSTVLWRLVDADVFDVEAVDVETLEFGVGLGVSQELEEVLARLFWPSTLAGLHAWRARELLGLGASADTAVEADEADASLVLDDILEVALSLAKVHALDHLGRFAGVLEVNTDVLAAGFAALGRVGRFGHVSSHAVWCFLVLIFFFNFCKFDLRL